MAVARDAFGEELGGKLGKRGHPIVVSVGKRLDGSRWWERDAVGRHAVKTLICMRLLKSLLVLSLAKSVVEHDIGDKLRHDVGVGEGRTGTTAVGGHVVVVTRGWGGPDSLMRRRRPGRGMFQRLAGSALLSIAFRTVTLVVPAVVFLKGGRRHGRWLLVVAKSIKFAGISLVLLIAQPGF